MSIGATLLVLELGARAIIGSFASFAPAAEVGGHSIVDRDVGYLLRDDVAVRVREGYEVHTRAHGIRSNGDQRPSRDRPITLVVGDSFAFGDEVLDSESWPAVLEKAIDAPVVNAAVAGFGLDQSVLRAERLAPIVAPDRIIVSFVPHDVSTTRFAATARTRSSTTEGTRSRACSSIDSRRSGASVARRSFSSRSRRRRCRPIRGTRRIRATHVLTRSSHRS